jgi:hypothetical protein
MGKRGLAGVFIVLAVVAGAWYWSTWRRSDSALSSLRLRVSDSRGHVEGVRNTT